MQHRPFRVSGRRRFLAGMGALAASPMLLTAGKILGANDRIRVGLIGCGERGIKLIQDLRGIAQTVNAELVAVSDPDTRRMAQASKQFGDKPLQIRDYRQLLERKDIDAVIIASPNYWHALHTIHACQAGKDVYVEKPVSGDIFAGRQMAAAVEKYQRVAQAGTQNRSDYGLANALQFIREGKIGKIKAVYGNCFRNRTSIGKLDKPLVPPAELDYDLWLGPAQDKPIYRPQLHYDWHWDFNTGNGDIGNQGPHELDLMSWFLGDPVLPEQMLSFGGRFGWNDAGDTPNMQTAVFEMAGVPCTFEVNNMWLTPSRNVPALYKGIRVGIIVTCENGEFRGGRGGGYVLGPDGKEKIAKFPGDGGGNHMKNFFDVIRSRRMADLAAPVSHSHKSSALAHLANISLRTGKQVPLDQVAAHVPQTGMIADILQRQHQQLTDWKIDLSKTTCSAGQTLVVNPATGEVSGTPGAEAFNRPVYRKGYEIPTSV